MSTRCARKCFLHPQNALTTAVTNHTTCKTKQYLTWLLTRHVNTLRCGFLRKQKIKQGMTGRNETQTHTHTHKYTHTNTHTQIHTHTHTHIHTTKQYLTWLLTPCQQLALRARRNILDLATYAIVNNRRCDFLWQTYLTRQKQCTHTYIHTHTHIHTHIHTHKYLTWLTYAMSTTCAEVSQIDHQNNTK